MNQYIEIIHKSFTKGPVAWFCWIIPTICTITTKAWHEQPVLKDIYAFLGTTGMIELCVIILLCRFIYVVFSMYQSVLSTKHLKVDVTTIITELNTCLLELNEAKVAATIDDRSILLQKFCNKSKYLFDKVSNTHCCVSIKVVLEDAHTNTVKDLVNRRVNNLLHDDSHQDRHSEHYKDTEHIISANTAFNNVVNNIYKKKHYFIGKNLRDDENYLTSSAACAELEGKTYNQDLPYGSELVYPIFKRISNSNNQLCLRGFLCIDSESNEGFNSDGMEVLLARILSNGLYDLIPLMNKP